MTIGSSASYQVWIDGVSIISGTGNVGSGSSNGFEFFQGGTGGYITIDDFYLFDNTGSSNNAALLTNPRIETQYPTGDSQSQFTNQASVIGSVSSATSGSVSVNSNSLMLRSFTPQAAMILNSVSCVPASTNGIAKFKAVVYSDNSGSPHNLLSSGNEVVGCNSGVAFTGALVTPQSLISATPYWIGFILDTTISFDVVNSSLTGKLLRTLIQAEHQEQHPR